MAKNPTRLYFLFVFILFVLLATSICASIMGAEMLHNIAFGAFFIAVCAFVIHVCRID